MRCSPHCRKRRRIRCLFGMLAGDLADAGAPLGHDVVVYGSRLIDPIYNIAPVVMYGRTEISAANVVLKDDRLEVTLPDAVKTAVNFAPTPCASRPSFGLRVRSVYGETVRTLADRVALAGADQQRFLCAADAGDLFGGDRRQRRDQPRSRPPRSDFTQRGSLDGRRLRSDEGDRRSCCRCPRPRATSLAPPPGSTRRA